MEEQPTAKRSRGQSKRQTKTKEKPKEEIKSEGNVDLTQCHCNQKFVQTTITVFIITFICFSTDLINVMFWIFAC